MTSTRSFETADQHFNENQMTTSYEFRAPPRRRKQSSADEDQQPLFLGKAFNMINSCDPALGTISIDLPYIISLVDYHRIH